MKISLNTLLTLILISFMSKQTEFCIKLSLNDVAQNIDTIKDIPSKQCYEEVNDNLFLGKKEFASIDEYWTFMAELENKTQPIQPK